MIVTKPNVCQDRQMFRFPFLALRPVRSVKGNSCLTALLTALVVGISLLTANPTVAQVLTHGPVVGGVTDSGGNVFLRTDQAATVAVQIQHRP